MYCYATFINKKGDHFYQGQFKNGVFNGKGKYQMGEMKYDGEWSQGRKKGRGRMTFNLGSEQK